MGSVLSQVLELVRTGAPLLASKFHGESHWERVALTGMAIWARVPVADPLVVVLFALLHDSRRVDEGYDPDHGGRAAQLVGEMLQAGRLPISNRQADLIQQACSEHSWAKRTEDPTLGACWDADRIDLRRFEIALDPARLSHLGLDVGAVITEVDAGLERFPGWEWLLLNTGWPEENRPVSYVDAFEKIAQARTQAVTELLRGLRSLVPRVSVATGLRPDTVAALACEAAAELCADYSDADVVDTLRWMLDQLVARDLPETNEEEGIVYE